MTIPSETIILTPRNNNLLIKANKVHFDVYNTRGQREKSFYNYDNIISKPKTFSEQLNKYFTEIAEKDHYLFVILSNSDQLPFSDEYLKILISKCQDDIFCFEIEKFEQLY